MLYYRHDSLYSQQYNVSQWIVCLKTMKECPSCYDKYDEEDMVLPHCGNAEHSACKHCTQLWYTKQAAESCMLCRAVKAPPFMSATKLILCLGAISVILSVLLSVLRNWFVLMINAYAYSMFYIYFGKLPTFVMTYELFVSFCFAADVTIYCFIIMFTYFSFSTLQYVLYTMANVTAMFELLHFASFVCSGYQLTL